MMPLEKQSKKELIKRIKELEYWDKYARNLINELLSVYSNHDIVIIHKKRKSGKKKKAWQTLTHF